MSKIAGIHDLREFGAPGDLGVFQLPYTQLIFPFIFNGVTYCVALDGSNGKTKVDTIANSAVVWQYAINICQVSGGSIKARKTTYPINTKLTVTEPITIQGEGGEWENTAKGTILQASAAIDAILEINIAAGGALTNVKTGGNYRGFLLDGNANATVDLLITNAVRLVCDGITCINAKTWGLDDLTNHTHHYIHCRFSVNGAHNVASPPTSGGAKLGLLGGTQLNASQFDSCSWEANLGCGLYIANTLDATLNTPVIEANYSFGLYARNAVNTLVVSGWFEANSQVGGQASANRIAAGIIYAFINPYFDENLCTDTCLETSGIQSLTIINPFVNVPAKGISAYGANGLAYIGNLAFMLDFSFILGGNVNALDISTTTHGFATTTPGVPASTSYIQNTHLYPVVIYILTIGTVTQVKIKDIAGTIQTIVTSLTAGQCFIIQPFGSIAITYAPTAPTWKWMGL